MDARRFPYRSQNVIDHRGDDWRLRNFLLIGSTEDEGPQADLGPRWNALSEAIVKRRIAEMDRQKQQDPNAIQAWINGLLAARRP